MKKNWIKNFDLLHIPMSLSYKNEYFYKTNIGAALTIICFIIIICISSYEIKTLVDKTSFSLITSQYMDLSKSINFSESILLFQLVDSSGKEIENRKQIYEFKAYDMESVLEYTSTGKKYSKTITNKLEMDYCDNILLNDIEYLTDLNLSNYLCLKPGQNITSYGFLGDISNGYKGIRIYLNKCNNSKTNCDNEDIIKTKLQNSKFRVAYISLNTNIFDMKSKNLSFQLFSKSCSVSTNLLKKFHFSFSIGKFHLYNDAFFKKEKLFDYIIGHEPSMDVDLDPSSTLKNNNNTLAYFSFNYDGNIVEISKEVKRFFDVFSIIGNAFNIILTFFKIINNYYSNKVLFVDIFKNIFFCKDKPNSNYNKKFNFPLSENNGNLNNSNIQNLSKKNVLDLSDGLILNHNNKNNSIQKKSSYNKMIITSDKSNSRLKKRGSYVFKITKEEKKRLMYFYFFPLWILKKHKLFNNIYLINERICNYFSIEKINEVIKFKEAFSHRSKKMKINNTDLIKVEKKFQDADSYDFQQINKKPNH